MPQNLQQKIVRFCRTPRAFMRFIPPAISISDRRTLRRQARGSRPEVERDRCKYRSNASRQTSHLGGGRRQNKCALRARWDRPHVSRVVARWERMKRKRKCFGVQLEVRSKTTHAFLERCRRDKLRSQAELHAISGVYKTPHECHSEPKRRISDY